MKILIVYYSLYGHVQAMAQAAEAELKAMSGVEPVLRRVPETLPEEVIDLMGATETAAAQQGIPLALPNDLAEADGILFGAPTRFGNMCGQMRQFLDATGGLWAKGALVGKPGGAFTSSNTQHGGQETTIITFLPYLLHQGMVVVGLPYTFQGQTTMTEICGGSPYGASTIAGNDGSRSPSEIDLNGVRFQARYLADVAAKLKG